MLPEQQLPEQPLSEEQPSPKRQLPEEQLPEQQEVNRKSAGKLLIAAAVVLAVALVAVLVVVLGRGNEPLPSTTSSPLPSISFSPAEPSPVMPSLPPPVAKADPVSLSIPALAIDAPIDLYSVAMAQQSKNPLTGVACYDGGRISCVNPPRLGDVYWLKAGVGKIPFGDQPGSDAAGTVYLVGHSSWTKQAVFNDLYELTPGADVSVTTANGVVPYTVQEVILLDKADWSSSAYANEQVAGRLILATCYQADGAPTAGNGASTKNVIVVAQTATPALLGN